MQFSRKKNKDITDNTITRVLKKKSLHILALNLLLFSLNGCEEIGELIRTNKNPNIDSLFALRETLTPTDTTTIIVEAHDPEGESLSFEWGAEQGLLSSTSGQKVLWTAPAFGGSVRISVKVTDESKGKAEAFLMLSVLASEKPTVKITHPENDSHIPGLGAINIEAVAGHPNGIREVLFFVDGMLLGRDDSPPYALPWQIEGKSGESEILAQAFRAGTDPGEPGIDSVLVTIEGATRL